MGRRRPMSHMVVAAVRAVAAMEAEVMALP
jgi:hypothetical protein